MEERGQLRPAVAAWQAADKAAADPCHISGSLQGLHLVIHLVGATFATCGCKYSENLTLTIVFVIFLWVRPHPVI